MKFKEFKHEPVQPDTYEASMALNQLMRIGKHAIKLHNMIDDAAEMESWVAKKIDLAGDYVKKVYNYTCLLYTSPSPRDRQKSRMPSSA